MYLVVFAANAAGLVVVRPSAVIRTPTAARTRTPPLRAQQSFDTSAAQFDLLSLRTFRRDTILQYDATNQSEPLRIALTLFGLLFSLCIPALATELRIDGLTADVAAVMGTGVSGALFLRNRGARLARMAKIDREYAMGDLRATYRGVRTSSLGELRGKRRVVAVIGSKGMVDDAVARARVYRRRLAAAGAVVVPVYADGIAVDSLKGEAESTWLWSAAEPQRWLSYFEELCSSRGSDPSAGAWIGLNVRGRTFGSALGAPRWDEILGTALQPTGDGFGEFVEVPFDAAKATAEAAAAALVVGGAGGGQAAVAAAEGEAAALLEAQAAFYAALTSGDADATVALWDAAAGDEDLDPYVSDVVAAGSRVEPWVAGSNAFPPTGMRATDRDALLLSPSEGWTTAVERPAEGGTLLATQVWRRAESGGAWRLAAHRYIPWSADGATAVAALRCDRRGCVLIGREINTRAP